MNFLLLPKIDLHCHLDGSVRPETMLDIAQKEGIILPSFEIETIKKQVMVPLECKSLNEYLEAFIIPNLVMQSKESLKRITLELFEDAAKENVKYMEVRFAPLLHTQKGLQIQEIIQSVIDGMRLAEEKYDIKGNIILSCMRSMSMDKAFEIVEEGKKFLGKGVVAIDLCGVEEAGFCKKFIAPMALAKRYGYRITIHAGETGIGKNVLEAVELLGAERIGHGVFIKDCEEAYKVVKDKNITLEICPTSNIQTKAISCLKDHPIYDFYKDGLKVTVNTDNRVVSNTDMMRELEVTTKEFNITEEDYKEIYKNSIEASFCDLETKTRLKSIQLIEA